jgi:crossover junction endodeoxyribonuclease RusA
MIILSWPPKELSPNARIHWGEKHKVAKTYRIDAGWATKASKDQVIGEGMIDLKIIFYPPNKQQRDLDNCLASIKSGLDGIADGLGVNDSRFRLSCEIGPVKAGCGEVRVIIK